MVIPFTCGMCGTEPKGLESGLEESEIRGRIETIQRDHSTRILRRVLETWEDLLSIGYSGDKLPVDTNVKKHKE